jgi:hypothetical protein
MTVESKIEFLWDLFTKGWSEFVLKPYFYLFVMLILFICGIISQHFLIKKFEKQRLESDIAENVL